jgi:hypothetical protein
VATKDIISKIRRNLVNGSSIQPSTHEKRIKGLDFARAIITNNSEERIYDLIDAFDLPESLRYSMDFFKDFSFDSYSVWWGDRGHEDYMEISHDSLFKYGSQEKDDPDLDIKSLLEDLADAIGDLAREICNLAFPIKKTDFPAGSCMNDVESLLDEFVLVMWDMAKKISFSEIDVSDLNKEIMAAKNIISKIRRDLVKGSSIQLSTHEKRIKGLDFARAIISNHTEEIIEEVIGAYKIMLFEFNACIIEYNRLNPESPLSPLAFTNVCPLNIGE